MAYRGTNPNSNTVQVWDGTAWIAFNPLAFTTSGVDAVLSSAGAISIDNTAGASAMALDSGGAMTITAGGGPMTLTTVGAASSLSIFSDLGLSIDNSFGAGDLSLDSGGAMILTANGGAMTLTTVGAASPLNLQADSTLNIDNTFGAGQLSIDSGGAMVLTAGGGAMTLTTVGAGTSLNVLSDVDVNLTANAGAGNFNVTADNTVLSGNLVVNGTTTSVNTTEVLAADNYFNLNQGYTTNGVPRPGGLVVDLEPQAVPSNVSGGAFTAATTVEAAGMTLSPGDFIMIDGAADPENNGLFQVTSYADPVITINASGEDFTQSGFQADATVQGTVSPMLVSVIRCGTTGDWEQGSGATAPIVYSAFVTSATISLQGAYDGGQTVLTNVGAGFAPVQITAGSAGPPALVLDKVAGPGGSLMVLSDGGATFLETGPGSGFVANLTTAATTGTNFLATVDGTGVISLTTGAAGQMNFSSLDYNFVAVGGSSASFVFDPHLEFVVRAGAGGGVVTFEDHGNFTITGSGGGSFSASGQVGYTFTSSNPAAGSFSAGDQGTDGGFISHFLEGTGAAGGTFSAQLHENANLSGIAGLNGSFVVGDYRTYTFIADPAGLSNQWNASNLDSVTWSAINPTGAFSLNNYGAINLNAPGGLIQMNSGTGALLTTGTGTFDVNSNNADTVALLGFDNSGGINGAAVDVHVSDRDPNGNITAAIGSICLSTVSSGTAWINTDGATTWDQFAGSGSVVQSLQAAYDGGNAIVTSGTPVQISGPAGASLLTLNKAAGAGGPQLTISDNGATNLAIGPTSGFVVDLTTTDTTGLSASVTTNGAGTVSLATAAGTLSVAAAGTTSVTSTAAATTALLAGDNSGGTNGVAISHFQGDFADPNSNITPVGVGDLYLSNAGSGSMWQNTDGTITGWVQFGTAGGNDLQAAYAAGNSISVSAANGTISFANTTDNQAVLLLNNTGTGNTLQVQDGGSDVLVVNGAGAVSATPTSGQNFSVTTLGAGTVALTSAAAITLDSATVATVDGATSVDVDIAGSLAMQFDAASATSLATASTGDVVTLAPGGAIEYSTPGSLGQSGYSVSIVDATVTNPRNVTATEINASEITIAVTNSTGQNMAVNIPDASTVTTGARLVVKDASGTSGGPAADRITITPAVGTIDGAASQVLATNYSAATFQSDGTNWMLI